MTTRQKIYIRNKLCQNTNNDFNTYYLQWIAPAYQKALKRYTPQTPTLKLYSIKSKLGFDNRIGMKNKIYIRWLGIKLME